MAGGCDLPAGRHSREEEYQKAMEDPLAASHHYSEWHVGHICEVAGAGRRAEEVEAVVSRMHRGTGPKCISKAQLVFFFCLFH